MKTKLQNVDGDGTLSGREWLEKSMNDFPLVLGLGKIQKLGFCTIQEEEMKGFYTGGTLNLNVASKFIFIF